MAWLTNPYRFGGAGPFMQAILTVPAGKVLADVSGFPIRVNLANMPAGFWSVVAAGGADIRVKTVAGVELPIDVVWLHNNQGEMFFRADLLAATDNVFRIYAGSGEPAPAHNSPTGRYAVWAGYSRIIRWAGPNGALSGDNATNVAACNVCRASGTVGSAIGVQNAISAERLLVSGGSGGVRCEMAAPHFADWTMAGVLWKSSAGAGGQDFAYRGADSNDYVIALPWASGATAFRTLINGGTTNHDAFSPPADALYHVGVQSVGNIHKAIINGVVGTVTRTADRPVAADKLQTGPGFGTTFTRYLLTYIRENTVSAARLKAENDSWVNPSSFYTVS